MIRTVRPMRAASRLAMLTLGLTLVACRSGSVPVTAPPPAEPAGRPSARPAVTVVAHQHLQQEIRRRLQVLARSGPGMLASGEVGYYLDVQQARLQQVVGTRVSIERQDSRIVLRLAGASFEVASSRLASDAEATLGLLAKPLIDYRLTLVSVHGHADASGDEDANLELSERRALAVAEFLLDRGVSPERLLAVGHGQSLPLAPNSSPEGRDRNRRIELHLDPIASTHIAR